MGPSVVGGLLFSPGCAVMMNRMVSSLLLMVRLSPGRRTAGGRIDIRANFFDRSYLGPSGQNGQTQDEPEHTR
jgi:hypothetical protein